MTVWEQEEAIRRQTFESAFAWDAAGALVLAKEGEQYQINFSDDELSRMMGAVLTHNHPRGLEFSEADPRSFGNSFSMADLNLACVARLSELRVVTPRLRFSLKPSPGGWDEAHWENLLKPVYVKHKSTVSQDLSRAVQEGTMTLADAEARHFHELCVRVPTELALVYVREESSMPFLWDDTEVNLPAYGDRNPVLVAVPQRRKLRKALTVRRLQEVELRRRLLGPQLSARVANLLKEHQRFSGVVPQDRMPRQKKYNLSQPGLYRLLMLVLQEADASQPPLPSHKH